MSSPAAVHAGTLAAAGAQPATGRQAFSILWSASRPLTVGVVGWVLASAVLPALVVVALGEVVAAVPKAILHGLNSPAGDALLLHLGLAAVVYASSLIVDPIGSALGTAAKATITTDLQQRLMRAVSGPVGITHLEDPQNLDRLARAEGSLTGFFPGDAPVTWAGIISSRLSGIIGCAVLAALSWWLGLGLLVTWLIVRRIMLRAVVHQAVDLRAQTAQMRRAWYFTAVGSKARDAKEVRVYGLSDFVAEVFRREYRDAIAAGTQGMKDVHRRAVGCFVIVVAAYASALSIVAYDAHNHSISLRSLAILLPMIAVTMSAGSVSFDDITLTWALAGLPDVDRLETDLATSVELQGHREIGGRPRQAVRFHDVHFRYASGDRDVLCGLDLDLPAGTSTALVGVNGAGKSTLVGLLCRLRDASSGTITVDDEDLRTFDARTWQRAVAVMPQDPARYPFSAYDNIAFGAIEHGEDRCGVERAAALAGFDEVVTSLPHGWDTVLSRELPGGVDLSGGQWQRLALARALFATQHGARLLVLDEPTAALDVRSEARFYGRFFEITAGLTTLVISHRFATVRRAQHICVLDGGRITERGSHDDLLASGGTYAQMYRLQASRFAAGANGG